MRIVRKLWHPIIWPTYCACLCLLVLTFPRTFSVPAQPVSESPGTQDEDSLTATFVTSLWSSKSEVRTASEEKLILLAQKSESKRALVIDKLISAVNAEKELDGTHTILKNSFLFWESVTRVFTALNATEASDVLIRCVQCSNGWSGRMGEPPASIALVRMGQPILSRLSNALGQEPNAYKRIKIVLCIARIGGTEAISDLERALRSERNKGVRDMIRFSLSEMKSN